MIEKCTSLRKNDILFLLWRDGMPGGRRDSKGGEFLVFLQTYLCEGEEFPPTSLPHSPPLSHHADANRYPGCSTEDCGITLLHGQICVWVRGRAAELSQLYSELCNSVWITRANIGSCNLILNPLSQFSLLRKFDVMFHSPFIDVYCSPVMMVSAIKVRYERNVLSNICSGFGRVH
jgi:hypothetical protein